MAVRLAHQISKAIQLVQPDLILQWIDWKGTNAMTDRQKGILCIVLSALSFALMNVFVRMAGDLPSAEKSLFRNLIAAFVAGVVLVKEGNGFSVPKKAWPDLLIRSTLGTVGILCNFYAVDHLLLADATAIQKLIPFITILMSWLVLREKPMRVQLVLVGCAFLASLLVVKPSFSNANLGASLIQVLGAIVSGAAYVYVRKLSLEGVAKSKIIFYFSAFSLLVFLPMTMISFKMPSFTQLLCLLMAGVMATCGQYTVTYAYSFAPASEISICDYSQILFSALFGFFFFGQQADLLSWIGYGLLILFALLNYMIGMKKKQTKTA